ncbi:MerR family transcriptional regulator [Polynucleobacter sp. 71A-WALBACH]|uniref:helix-turn-helix domain-containing protein n=1 Tax=Polynucleobacter sp. 71A-WALBACH TaxID=2689097 RepID=UPI001C0D826B|nr:helix-turn-helix domain-containing protein [Polynucleobacter sp. 71A-WALBACH]MBU3594598.1 MerR family transcriptional regulator [Polynucleobacter sp. 71A-WALBACH]
MEDKKYTFEELCTLTGVSSRTLRYYIQIGLVDKPIGQTRGAHYLSLHIEKILRIKQLTEAGISLERIREVLSGSPMPLPERTKKPGDISVRTHLWVGEGIELEVSAETAGLSPEKLRQFLKGVMQAYEQVKKDA